MDWLSSFLSFSPAIIFLIAILLYITKLPQKVENIYYSIKFKRKIKELNSNYFNLKTSLLPKCIVVDSDLEFADFDCLLNKIRINVDNLKIFTEIENYKHFDINKVLIHEMIHWYLWQIGDKSLHNPMYLRLYKDAKYKDEKFHGIEFKTIAKLLNSETYLDEMK
ncbi:SprT-like domain-containing protein [Candidatus Pacearchaeota archaeon]|jgi:hypothetical protein|nr:SprT-like domain-containing protein [Candidatus Pacearchaeota archaeon]